MANVFVGIDWGTHSSKWIYQGGQRVALVGTIWDSAIHRTENAGNGVIEMYPLRSYHESAAVDTELKRKIIDDPGQPFWEGARVKLGVTLGEAVVFSLLVLLEEAAVIAKDRANVDIRNVEGLVLRFSHPNWMVDDGVLALSNFRDAVRVAVYLFRKLPAMVTLTEGKASAKVNELHEAVITVLSTMPSSERFQSRYEYEKHLKCSVGEDAGVEWQLVFESCVAGFPTLVEMDAEAFEGNIGEAPKYRKLLVVDIGAGSTDVGYMVRTLKPDSSGRPASMQLLWLPAALALERGGNWLTQKVGGAFAQAGTPVTRREAEAHKVGPSMDWDAQYVVDWCEAIANHVSQYVRSIPDSVRLPYQPSIEVVLTGGASQVAPIGVSIVDSVKAALRSRGITNAIVVDGTAVAAAAMPSLFAGRSAVEVAQLAVSLGASDPRLTELKHYQVLQDVDAAVSS